jgi:hypothetical protein
LNDEKQKITTYFDNAQRERERERERERAHELLGQTPKPYFYIPIIPIYIPSIYQPKINIEPNTSTRLVSKIQEKKTQYQYQYQTGINTSQSFLFFGLKL